MNSKERDKSAWKNFLEFIMEEDCISHSDILPWSEIANPIADYKKIRFTLDQDTVVEKFERVENYLEKSFQLITPFLLYADRPHDMREFPAVRLASSNEYIKTKYGDKHKHGEPFTRTELVSILPNIIYVSPCITRKSAPIDLHYDDYEFKASFFFERYFKPKESTIDKVESVCLRIGHLVQSVSFSESFSVPYCDVYKRAEAEISDVERKNWYVNVFFHKIEKKYWRLAKKELKYIWKS